MKNLRSILMLLVAVAATSACDKNAVQQIAGPQAGGANVKFFNFAVGSPSVNFYVNNVKTTGVGATGCYRLTPENEAECTTTGIESTSGTTYGNAGSGAWYADIAPGQITVQGRVTASGDDNNLPISSTTASIERGKFYSFYQSGIYDGTNKTAESFIVEDPIPELNYSTAYVRFVNASSNASSLTLYATNTETSAEMAVSGQVAYQGAGTFVAVPAGTYNLAARGAGGVDVFTRSSVSFFNGRVYTITARGDVVGNTGKFLDNTTNR